jgi:hypothetical protein
MTDSGQSYLEEGRVARESCAERASGTLDAVRKAMMAVDNAMEQDAVYEAWEEAVWSTSELEYAVEQLRAKVSEESRKAEEDE